MAASRPDEWDGSSDDVAVPARKRARRNRAPSRRATIVSIFRPEGMRGGVLPFVRKDSLPDHATYGDSGCELARSCLRCPLPRCQYDAPRSVERWLIAARDREIALLRRRHGVAVETLARAYGVGERQVWNILRRSGSRGERWEVRSENRE